MAPTLEPASSLDEQRLATLFTAVYAGYWHPIEVDVEGLRRMVATYDLDLEHSVVAVDAGEPVAVAMLAVRDGEGWVGGMGVVPEQRRAGLGTRITRRLLDNARELGLRRVRLEVLEQNTGAEAIYRQLGFESHRRVGVWQLAAPPDADPAEDADPEDVLSSLGSAAADAPWQRSAATIARMRAHGAVLSGARCVGGSALFAVNGPQSSLLAIEAGTGDAVRELLATPFAAGASSLLWLNGALDSPVARELEAAGASPLARQHELQWMPGAS